MCSFLYDGLPIERVDMVMRVDSLRRLLVVLLERKKEGEGLGMEGWEEVRESW